MGDDLLSSSALELARRIRAREVSALDVVDAHIVRIELVNPRINAVVAERFEAARSEARTLDSVPCILPLAGVPFTVKEMIEVEGMPLTFGSLRRRERRGLEDATVVQRLRAAGGIPLGVTNIPEWGMWFESYNYIYGRTSNPWDIDRTPGGSSGGEGAIVGAGGSAFGIGSDIGGSVRMPAAFCGVYGHKPSTGLLPLTGHYPVYRTGPDAALRRISPYVTIGTLTRSADDIALLRRVMHGADGVDPNVRDVALQDEAAIDWQGRRVLVSESPSIALAASADVDARAAVRSAATVLGRHGAEIVDAPPKLLRRANDLWSAALQSEGVTSFSEILGGGTPVHLLREAARTLLRRGEYSWPALFFCAGERLGRMGERKKTRVLAELTRVGLEIDALLGDGGLFLMPSHPRVAPKHDAPIRRPFDFLYTAVWNATRGPATSVPFGFDAAQLPLSVQLAAAYGNDNITIAAARVLEAENAPWHPAPM
jgi:fatty acid amide hydrolase 2